jgi:hypothetical protein
MLRACSPRFSHMKAIQSSLAWLWHSRVVAHNSHAGSETDERHAISEHGATMWRVGLLDILGEGSMGVA